MQPDRRTVGVLLIGVLAALALSLAAATLANPTASAEGGTIGIEGNLSGLFEDDDVDPVGGSFPDLLATILRIVIALTMVAGTVIGLYVLDLGDFAKIVAIAVAAVAVLWLLIQLVSLLSGSGGDFGVGGSGASLGGGQGLPSASGEGSVSPLLLGGVGMVALFALIVLFALSTDDTAPDREPEPDASGPASLESVGRAAGRAADRIEGGSATPSNAVYRAWVEMTAALAVKNRESTTPGEFAEVAVEAGMDPDDVGELTRLFEDVRYGDEPVSEDRAEQAQAALRRIEAAYAGEER